MNDIERAIHFLKHLRDNKQYLQAYDIPTNTAISALEKQIPKKPIEQELRYRDQARIGKCPSCKLWWVVEFKNHCPGCGQAIDWRNEDE